MPLNQQNHQQTAEGEHKTTPNRKRQQEKFRQAKQQRTPPIINTNNLAINALQNKQQIQQDKKNKDRMRSLFTEQTTEIPISS